MKKWSLLPPPTFPTHRFPFTYKHLNHGFSQPRSVNEVSCPGRGGHRQDFCQWRAVSHQPMCKPNGTCSAGILSPPACRKTGKPRREAGKHAVGHFHSAALQNSVMSQTHSALCKEEGNTQSCLQHILRLEV